MTIRRAGFAAVLLTLLASAAIAADADRTVLLEGVNRIACPGVPGPMCVFGDAAFPVLLGRTSSSRAPLVAAMRLGTGRVVAFGHTGYFEAESLAFADTARLLANAARWAGNKRAPRIAIARHAALFDALRKQGFDAAQLSGPLATSLRHADVLCLNASQISADADLAAVRSFVQGGGGLIIVSLGWGWLQLNPGKSLTDHPGNRLLAPVGLAWADGTFERDGNGFAADASSVELAHAGVAARRLLAKAVLAADDLDQAVASILLAARTVPPDDKLLRPMFRQLAAGLPADAVPTAAKRLPSTPVSRLALGLQFEQFQQLPPERVTAHPAAASFPGVVPATAPRVRRTLTIDTSIPNWHSTGLYAAPGEVLVIDTPATAARLRVRIGAHTDQLWNARDWARFPAISATVPLKQSSTRCASPFGGLVYIDVPDRCTAGPVSVTIANAVEAPLYILGQTKLSDWTAIRQHPAPWAEVASDKVIITIPAQHVRALENPEPLMRFWNRVLDACADLAARPARRERPERYVADVQISAGYMHSGYPIMTHLDVAALLVDQPAMANFTHPSTWGLFHEMGHNHQRPDWTFEGTGEVTVNLFTRYVLDTVCGIPVAKQRPFDPAKRAAYLAAPDFARWKADPFLALAMYDQLQAAFGWEPFKRVFAEYRDLPAAQRPQNDNDKRDQWMIRFSRTVNRNLASFFQAWGVPTSDTARHSLADLPPWPGN